MKLPIYLDHNATTPVDPEVVEAMLPYFSEVYGNPSSIMNQHGAAAASAIERARSQVATLVGVQPEEIVFTGSCTEANNLAISGIVSSHPNERIHIVTSAIEHPSVARVCEHLENDRRISVTRVGVDEYGVIDIDCLRDSITSSTRLVTVMAANNEVGSKQPIAQIAAICAERGVWFHTDLAQAVGEADINLSEMRVTLASMSSHKVYGPKGVGALYIRGRRPRVRLSPIVHGGGQERGLRSGTLNVPAIVGMGEACNILRSRGGAERDRIRKIAENLSSRLVGAGAVLNGHPSQRIHNNVSVSFPSVDPHALMRNLRDEISFSTSSACSTSRIETSSVLLAMFGDTWRARNAFRLGLGRSTMQQDAEFAADAIEREAGKLVSFASAAEYR